MPNEQSPSAIGTQPLVSAIVSVYNAERFMHSCLEDLEAQTIADRLEIVIIDSGSQQHEWTIVREFQQRYDNIVYIRTARRESIYAAWNRGVQAARGTYITNANTDDRHKCDAFERMVATLEARPDIALVYADAYMTRTENETFETHTRVGSLDWPDFDPLELLRRCCVGPQPMWRKRMHTAYGSFDESFEVAGDWEFWLRIAENETFLHLPEFLGLYLSSPTGVENRSYELLSQENVRVYQRYVHRAEQRTNAEAVSGAAVNKAMNPPTDQSNNAVAVAGAAITTPMNIKAYTLYAHAVVVQRASVKRDGAAANSVSFADHTQHAASSTGWVLLCPHTFEATWNGGPNAEDIAIRLEAPEAETPAFVQSNLGSGLLTFYSGYQLQTTEPDSVWVRGPINWPKDGLYPLEQIVDTSLLPATITINWQCTRPNQSIRFEAGEPFCAILPYPSQYAKQFVCEVVELDDDDAVLEQALQQLTQAPDVQDIFRRLQQTATPAEPQLTVSAPQKKMRLLDHAKNVHSQNGEDGILGAVLETIGLRDKWCVEFGAWDGQYLSNTCNLIDNHGYSAVLIESNRQRFADLLKRHGQNPNVVALNQFVGFSANDGLDSILARMPIPKEFDLLSIDIDGNDYHVWNAVSTYAPKVVCIEYNPTIPTELDFVQPADPEVSQGASLLALTHLARQKEYELVAVTVVNAIFVRSEYFHLFQIANNEPRVLREDVSAITHVFCGYDGTIFVAGADRSPWHDFTYSDRLR